MTKVFGLKNPRKSPRRLKIEASRHARDGLTWMELIADTMKGHGTSLRAKDIRDLMDSYGAPALTKNTVLYGYGRRAGHKTVKVGFFERYCLKDVFGRWYLSEPNGSQRATLRRLGKAVFTSSPDKLWDTPTQRVNREIRQLAAEVRTMKNSDEEVEPTVSLCVIKQLPKLDLRPFAPIWEGMD